MAWRRCGSAGRYAPAPIADAIDRIRPPFNVSIPGLAAAVAALADVGVPGRFAAHVERWRPWLTQQLGGLGLDVVPSGANFVLVRVPDHARQDRAGSRGLPRLAAA